MTHRSPLIPIAAVVLLLTMGPLATVTSSTATETVAAKGNTATLDATALVAKAQPVAQQTEQRLPTPEILPGSSDPVLD